MAKRVENATEEIYKLGVQFDTQEDAETFLNRFTTLKRFKKYFEGPPIARTTTNTYIAERVPKEIVFGKTSHHCTAWVYDFHPPERMVLSPARQNAMHITHVLAHIVQPTITAFHGPEWVQIWLDLIERANTERGVPNSGRDVRRAVKDILMDHRVKTRAVSNETRLKQRDAYITRKVPDTRLKLLAVLTELGTPAEEETPPDD